MTYIFICGFLCSCAMILPGISGSYILLILGAYQFMLKKLSSIFINEPDSITYILTFAAGAILGILTFSRVIKWLFINFEDKTLIVLIGFILGSVTRIIPSMDLGVSQVTNFYNFFVSDVSLFLWVIVGSTAILALNMIGKENEV